MGFLQSIRMAQTMARHGNSDAGADRPDFLAYRTPSPIDGVLRALAGMGAETGPAVFNACLALYAPLHRKRDGIVVTRDLRYGPHERHRCDVFQPADAGAAPRPIVLFVHGGGYVRGAKALDGMPFYDNVGFWAAGHGFMGVTMNYRLAPRFTWPAGADDVAAAVAWLVSCAQAHGGDSARIFLVGHSAGAAHTASCLARLDDGLLRHVAGAALNSGIYDLTCATRFRSEIYYGADPGAHPAMSSAPALARLDTPLLLTVNELEPPELQRQGLETACAIFEAKQRLPGFVMLPGHNHYSSILHVGLPQGDLLGEHMLRFFTRNA